LQKKIVFSFFFFFAVLKIEPRAMHVLGKCSITKLHSQPETLLYLYFLSVHIKFSVCFIYLTTLLLCVLQHSS
jgi:hypothetical protein